LCIFFYLKRKDSIIIHMNEEGFDWKGGNYFILKDEWFMYEFFFLHFFENNFELIPHFIVILNSWNHSTLVFFYFFKSFLWSNQFTDKHFLFNHFFWNTIWMKSMKLPRLEKAWMRWWRLTRELPQFELVLGHKMCLGFPSY